MISVSLCVYIGKGVGVCAQPACDPKEQQCPSSPTPPPRPGPPSTSDNRTRCQNPAHSSRATTCCCLQVLIKQHTLRPLHLPHSITGVSKCLAALSVGLYRLCCLWQMECHGDDNVSTPPAPWLMVVPAVELWGGERRLAHHPGTLPGNGC